MIGGQSWRPHLGKGLGSLVLVVVVVVLAQATSESPAAAGGPVSHVWDTPAATARPGDPVVALTFDDGPNARWTPQVLAVLRRYGVPATFFVTGGSTAARPDLLRAMAAEGHSVQNHTWDHVNLTSLPAGGYSHQIGDTSRVIEGQTAQPVRCARPPYGALNGSVLDRLGARGLSTVTWTVDSSDYRRPGSASIARNVLAATRAGGIILMHDGGGDRSQTVAALPAIIEGLLARGYRFTPLCAQPKPQLPSPRYVDLIATAAGYWLARSDGAVDARNVPTLGSVSAPAQPLAGVTASPSGAGYWLVGADGGVFAFGDAAFAGSLGGVRLSGPVVGMAATPSGGGYWLVGGDGGIFGFGDAAFAGSLGGVRLDGPVVGMAATPSGRGYWLVGTDGGVHSFGDAAFAGSLGGVPLRSPIVGMTSTPTGLGYWLLGADGGVFAFGDAVFAGIGSLTSSGDAPG